MTDTPRGVRAERARDVATKAPLGRSWAARARRICLGALGLLVASCTEHSSVGVESGPVRLAIGAQIHAAGATDVGVRVTYRRASEEQVELTQLTIPLSTSTTQQVPLTVDISACLADETRAGSRDGCDAFITLTLLRDGTVLDTETVGPVLLRTGETATVDQPVQLFEVSQVTVRAPAGSTLAIETQDTLLLVASALDASNAPIDGKTFAWQGSNPSVATVDPATGRVIAVAPGTVVVTATAGGRSGQATVTVSAPVAASVTLAPPTSNLNVGQQVQLTATVKDKRGNTLTGRTVTYQSSNVTIATVSATGLVRAVGAGAATITGTADGKSGTAQITATRVLGVTVDGIFLGGTQTPANAAAIAGTIDVDVTYSLIAGVTATKLELLLGGAPVLSQTLSASSCTTCTFTLNTAAFNPTTGAASFTNGNRALAARLTFADNTTLSSGAMTVTFANASGFYASPSFSNPNGPATATNTTTGQTWVGGTVTLNLLPVSYVANQTITGVSGTFFGKTFTSTLTGNIFQIQFSGASSSGTGIAGYQSPAAGDAPVITSSTTNTGGAGPTLILNATAPPPGNPAGGALGTMRVDNVPPAVPTVAAMPVWIGSGFSFATSAGITPGADAGVGGVTSEFWTGFALSGGACDLTGLTKTTFGADLQQQPTPAYKGRAVTKDKLGNASCAPLAPGGVSAAFFGVERQPPTISAKPGPTDGSVWTTVPPGFAFQIGGSASGFPANPLMAKLTLTNPSGTSCVVGTGASCDPVASAVNVISNNGVQGYYTGDFSVTSIAGNTASLHALYLFDALAPVIGSIGLPSGMIAGNGTAVFGISATDNIDLEEIAGSLDYSAPASEVFFSFEYPAIALSGFGPPLQTSTTQSYSISNIMRCIDGVKLTSITVRALDQAGTNGFRTQGIGAAAVQNCDAIGNGPTPVSQLTIGTPQVSTLSRDGQTASVATSVALAAGAFVDGGGGGQPFARVEFWWQDITGNYHLAGSGAPGAPINFGSGTLWPYTFTFNPDSSVPIGPLTLLAVGVDNGGDAMSGFGAFFTIVP